MIIQQAHFKAQRVLAEEYPDCFIAYSDLSALFSAPFQLALDLAKALDEAALKAVFDLICDPLVKKHRGSAYEYWIDYESMGNVTAAKALAIFKCLQPYLLQSSKP